MAPNHIIPGVRTQKFLIVDNQTLNELVEKTVEKEDKSSANASSLSFMDVHQSLAYYMTLLFLFFSILESEIIILHQLKNLKLIVLL